MKKSEEFSLPHEFDRRLKLGIDRLREVRETAEELTRIADTIQPLLGVSLPPGRARAEPPPRQAKRAVEARKQEVRTEATHPPVKHTPTPPGRAAEPESEELPEWRKLFPELSAKVPMR